jgi:hypothetical protein
VPSLIDMQMIFVEPFEVAAGGVAPSFTVSRGVGAANLIEHDPREVWRDTGAAGVFTIDIDLGVPRDWDTVALINVAAGETATLQVIVGGGSSGVVYFPAQPLRLASEDGVSPSGPALFWSGAPQNARYFQLKITPNSTAPISIGNLVLGKSFKPSQPREEGAGRAPADTGERSDLDNGGVATSPGFLRSGFKWVFGDLDGPDLKRLWGLFRRLRTTEPFLLVEDPTEGVAEGVHWCTFVELEPYGAFSTSKSRWALSVRDR